MWHYYIRYIFFFFFENNDQRWCHFPQHYFSLSLKPTGRERGTASRLVSRRERKSVEENDPNIDLYFQRRKKKKKTNVVMPRQGVGSGCKPSVSQLKLYKTKSKK
jgi:hypothetical protein